MRGSVLAGLPIALGLLAVSIGAKAIPIHVGLFDASGSHIWTSPVIGDPHGTLTLSGWEYDHNAWTAATMIGNQAKTGLGVVCNQQPAGNACSQGQIGSVPWQMIDMNISRLTGWAGLTINLLSVDPTFSGELLGATCTVGGSCAGTQLSACTNAASGGNSISCELSLRRLTLLGITDIWITPSATNPDDVKQGNILLGTDFTLDAVPEAVPEPPALGAFGLGLLLIGVFLGLRRRRDPAPSAD